MTAPINPTNTVMAFTTIGPKLLPPSFHKDALDDFGDVTQNSRAFKNGSAISFNQS